MVYCGKPSAACSECRKRKTRCDRATPSCSQCLRAHRLCPGYRSQLDLMFRNESDAVKVKAVKSKEAPRAKSKSPVEDSAQSSTTGVEASDMLARGNEIAEYPSTPLANTELCIKSMMPNYSMFPTLEERSVAFFGALAPTWFRAFDLVDNLCGQAVIEEHLQASISAVGLAGFSNAMHAPEIMARARRDYVKALQLTNHALRSPTAAKKDSTLFSVMVLSIYEMISGNNERSLDSWTEHIKGAAALVKFRGQEQFKSSAGQKLFLQVTSNLMLSCIQRTIPMPEHIIQLREDAEKFMDVDSPGWRLAGVIIDFTIFRSNVRECEIVGPRNVIEQALELDQRFINEFKDLPEEWKYMTVYTTENPDIIWNGHYHVYREYWMSHIWNGMRTCRILLHELIRDQSLAASTANTVIFTDDENAIQLDSSVKIMLEMQADILGSVPHHTPSLLNQSSSGLLDGSRSYFVLWPLFLVGTMDLTTEPIRHWAAARLRNIGETVGIRQAIVISELLARRGLPIAWDTKPTPRLMSHQTRIQKFWESEKPGAASGLLEYENSCETVESWATTYV
ncbi:hypothetical protein DL98DRAFT_417442 [Cadophora sp. DSE1049]|nr:hypothetical protein DL98DRAFT_417442 [Cadophora sp. DSE1049]